MKSIWAFLFVCFLPAAIASSVRLTNLKCDELRPEFSTFSRCDLKVIRRGVISMNLHVKLLQLPVTNITINLSLHKKVNGYRPFLYNVTVDYCKFQANRKRYPFAKIFFDMMWKDSNMNHTCPYNHDIIVDNLVFMESSFKYLPLPLGEYMFQLKVAAYNDWKADVRSYVAISKDL